MQTTILGRTGLEVSVAGMGCGGHARLGQSYGHSTDQSVALVRSAIDAGVNFIDTAADYHTETIVGQAVAGQRGRVVIATKQAIFRPGTKATGRDLLSADEFCQKVEENLNRLATDYIDILQLHGVVVDQYDHCRDELVPALMKLRDQGKVRFFGITERFVVDTNHAMLARALDDNFWDVAMIGFNLINPSARHLLMAKAARHNVGTLCMFAVRRALSDPAATAQIIADLRANGQVDLTDKEARAGLDFLTAPGVANSVIEAAYRFCRHEPGMQVILTGTGSVAHLHENLAAIQMPPLPEAILNLLHDMFGKVDSVSGN